MSGRAKENTWYVSKTEKVNGDGELIIIVEILETSNCRKHSPLPGLMEGKGGSGGCSRVLSKGHRISTGTTKRASGVQSGWQPLPEMLLEGKRELGRNAASSLPLRLTTPILPTC